MARPKEFEREEALQAALYLFWEKGYDATTLPELLEKMSISRSSLYDTFGDKQALFREALNLYLHQFAARRMPFLRKAKSAKQGITAYFQDHIEVALADAYPGGCFVTNTATTLKTTDEQIVNLITHGTEQLEEEFHALLQRGQEAREIPRDKDIQALARLFVGIAYGINVVARVSSNRERLEGMANAAIQTLS